MNIKSIDIHNYKGFKDCSLEFHPKLNVFIGSNASGKTTLLTAILKSLYVITKQFVPHTDRNDIMELTDSDLNYDSIDCHIVSTIDQYPMYFQDFSSIGFISPPGKPLNKNLEQKLSSVNEFKNWFGNEIRNSPETIPILKFYPANRGAIDYSETYDNNIYQISQLESWSNIYQNTLSYSRFFNWFYDNETNELRLQRDAEDFNVQSPLLKGVRMALNDAFKILGYGKVKIKTKQIKRNNSSKLTPTLVIQNLETGKIDEIDNKSDGEKAIITLIADLAYNLALAKDFTLDDDILKSPGVVMIDEIENHLHPKWQREIIPILTELFPDIQFFIATHSPQVLSSVNSESIFSCQGFQVEKINLKTKGEDSNTLLKHIFNATDRPKEYIDLLKKFDTLIETSATYSAIEKVINEVAEIEKEDKSTDINILVDELKLQLEAYKFDREYETNN